VTGERYEVTRCFATGAQVEDLQCDAVHARSVAQAVALEHDLPSVG
jgi:hypothetical protein